MGTLGIKIDYNRAMNEFYKVYNVITSIYPNYKVQVSGSVLRKKMDNIGDIDVLIVTPQGRFDYSFSDAMKSNGYKVDTSGDHISRLMTHDGVQIDLYCCSESELPTMKAYLTGPSSFNIGMRSRAKHIGLKLNQKELIDSRTGSKIIIHSEEELFNRLGCKYIDPENRIDWYKCFNENRI